MLFGVSVTFHGGRRECCSGRKRLCFLEQSGGLDVCWDNEGSPVIPSSENVPIPVLKSEPPAFIVDERISQ